MGAACGTIQTDTRNPFFTLQREAGLRPQLDATPVRERNADTRQPRKADHEERVVGWRRE